MREKIFIILIIIFSIVSIVVDNNWYYHQIKEFLINENSNNDNYDERSDAHGIKLIKKDNHQCYLMYSMDYQSNVDENSWHHDVYYREIEKNKIKQEKTLIHADEAQEPLSASSSKDGNIIISFEDGNNGKEYKLAQRYAIYNKDLKCIKKYPQTIELGGHSGHVASTDDYHIVFYCEGWIDNGGVNNLGSGHVVKIASMDSKGNNIKHKTITTNNHLREWWPLIASSHHKCFLLWQRFVDNEKYMKLCFSIYDPKSNSLSKPVVFSDLDGEYYNYGVEYLEQFNQFIVYASDTQNQGHLYLFSEDGILLDSLVCDDKFIREATVAIKYYNNQALLVYPSNDFDVSTFVVSDNKIKLGPKFVSDGSSLVLDNNVSSSNHLTSDVKWNIRGTVGEFISDNRVRFYLLGNKEMLVKEYKCINEDE